MMIWINLLTVDLTLANVKEVSADWLVEAADHISENPSFYCKLFGIMTAINEVYGHVHRCRDSEEVERIDGDDKYISDNGR